MRGPGEEGGVEYDPEEGLRRAVASFPLLVARLLAKLNDQGVGKGLDWQARPRCPGPAPAPSGVSAPAARVVMTLLMNIGRGSCGGAGFPSDACACCAYPVSACCWLVEIMHSS